MVQTDSLLTKFTGNVHEDANRTAVTKAKDTLEYAHTAASELKQRLRDCARHKESWDESAASRNNTQCDSSRLQGRLSEKQSSQFSAKTQQMREEQLARQRTEAKAEVELADRIPQPVGSTEDELSFASEEESLSSRLKGGDSAQVNGDSMSGNEGSELSTEYAVPRSVLPVLAWSYGQYVCILCLRYVVRTVAEVNLRVRHRRQKTQRASSTPHRN